MATRQDALRCEGKERRGLEPVCEAMVRRSTECNSMAKEKLRMATRYKAMEWCCEEWLCKGEAESSNAVQRNGNVT